MGKAKAGGAGPKGPKVARPANMGGLIDSLVELRDSLSADVLTVRDNPLNIHLI
jgi:hypothetical protein